eukprot:CAMPEP_0201568906 /NCGR_PEP_ID=MMETSP0190_2-20130828/10231_1 /ASSEMBLY_ACC=CAM_ASM_000263 /TAXON_ID=37353 /ORGANISM="Rosalina sp." /LENGTH=99 /DNA_ID=CAMNT_0047990569 /DNA_START=86 /DNA_END=385 /DNA_ORIENTATION=+
MMNATVPAVFTTEYISTTGFISTNVTTEPFESYPDISEDPGTEVLLALISVSVAVIVLFCYIRDLIKSGVCKKGFRHYDANTPGIEAKLIAEIEATQEE